MEFISSPLSSSSAPLIKALDVLLRGRQAAEELLLVLSDSPSALDIAKKILSSFDQAMSILASDHSSLLGLPDTPKSDYSEDSTRTSPVVKDRRGFHKRRKTLQTWTRESPTFDHDGYAWRKYGHKSIQNSQYPRDYYRCTYQITQGCPATKQVQRVQENPPVYRTVYQGHHTCDNWPRCFANPSQIMTDSAANNSPSMFNFKSYNPKTNKQIEQRSESFLSTDLSSATQPDNHRFMVEVIGSEDNVSQQSSTLDDAQRANPTLMTRTNDFFVGIDDVYKDGISDEMDTIMDMFVQSIDFDDNLQSRL